jgi:hypothetical protein
MKFTTIFVTYCWIEVMGLKLCVLLIFYAKWPQLRQPPTIEAVDRGQYFSDVYTTFNPKNEDIGVTRTDVNKYKGLAAKALAVSEPIVGWQNMAAEYGSSMAEFGRIWQVTRPSTVTMLYIFKYQHNYDEFYKSNTRNSVASVYHILHRNVVVLVFSALPQCI